MKTKTAYHFTAKDKLRDGTPVPPAGVWLEHTGPVKICNSGLHFSCHPFDALQYAPGPILHQVTVDGVVDMHHDKGVCRRRRIDRSVDATEMFRFFSRMQAVSCLGLWPECPPDVVLDYLMTGDPALRDAARAAAWAAAGAAERAAARAAAWAVAWAATDAAAGDAARAAAGAAARQMFKSLVSELEWRKE